MRFNKYSSTFCSNSTFMSIWNNNHTFKTLLSKKESSGCNFIQFVPSARGCKRRERWYDRLVILISVIEKNSNFSKIFTFKFGNHVWQSEHFSCKSVILRKIFFATSSSLNLENQGNFIVGLEFETQAFSTYDTNQ